MRKQTYEEILSKRKKSGLILNEPRHPVSLMLYDIRSLYNVGSIFRTADASLAGELILCGYTPRPPRPELDKTALGAADTVPWRYFKSAVDAVNQLKSEQKKIFALELTDSGRDYSSIEIADFPLCIVLGNELTGISDDILNLCDDALEIPMYGVKHSLNVAVAAGVAVYEAVKAYNEKRNAINKKWADSD